MQTLISRSAFHLMAACAVGLVLGCTGGAAPGWGSGSAPLSHASSIAVDATDVYWTDGTTIHRQSRSGGAVTPFATELCGGVDSVAVDGDHVYWSHGYTSTTCTASVSRTQKSGGPVEMLATGFVFNGRGGLVVDDGAVYFVAIALTPAELASVPSGLGLERSTVYSVAKSGGAPIALGGPFARGDPADDDQGAVYWSAWQSDPATAETPPAISIQRTDRKGTTVSLATATGNVAALAFFGARLDWVESGYHGAEYICFACDVPAVVRSMGSGDLAPVTEATAPPQALIHDAVVDSSGLWFTLEGTRSGMGVDYPPNDDHTGALVHVPTGGPATTALTGLPFMSDLAMDGSAVFATGDSAPQVVAK
jgi:hypothetical protein